MIRRSIVRLSSALVLAQTLLPVLPATPEPPPGSVGGTGEAQDVGQYFDRFTRQAGPRNYFDNSSHPLRGLTTTDNSLLFGAVDCLRCHYSSTAAPRGDSPPATTAPAGPRVSDECLKCHFEYQPNAPAPNHGNGVIELALPAGNDLPRKGASVRTILEYDAWCLSCHGGGSSTTLGNVAARGKTVINDNAFARGRHRAIFPQAGEGPIGCIHCHSAHGSGGTRLVREYPGNRRAAGNTPVRFGVHPGDNLAKGGYGTPRIVSYRSTIDRNVADADEDFNYCDRACHRGRKDHRILRDNTTGNYILDRGKRMIHVVGNATYTIDNLAAAPRVHSHPSQGIIPTDDMAEGFARLAGITGPTRHHYPGSDGNAPSAFGPAQNAASPLPFFPDFRDGNRDYPDGYLAHGPIRYRYSCSTCHDPHGTTLPNSDPSAAGYPDLRMTRLAPNDLCRQCH
jgi:hypothetical protein